MDSAGNHEEKNLLEKETPVTDRASEYLTEVFSELTDVWNEIKKSNKGIVMENVLKDQDVEDKLKAMRILSIEEVMDIVKIETLKIKNLENENEMLNKHKIELSQKLEIAENKICKAQNEVFDKMETTLRKVLDDFREREHDLLLKEEKLNVKVNKIEKQNEHLEDVLSDAQKMVQDLEKRLEDAINEKAKLKLVVEEATENNEKLAEKLNTLENENSKSKSLVNQLKNNLSEVQYELDSQTTEVSRLQRIMVNEDGKNREKAKKFENEMQEQMDAYQKTVQQRLHEEIRSKDEQIIRKLKDFEEREVALETRNRNLAHEVKLYREQVERLQLHNDMIESKIKDRLKRNISTSYRDMLNIVSEGAANNLLNESSNPFSRLTRHLEDNRENLKKATVTVSSPPPPTKRNVAISTDRSSILKKNNEVQVLKRALPPGRRHN